jgi:hypothetical protein
VCYNHANQAPCTCTSCVGLMYIYIPHLISPQNTCPKTRRLTFKVAMLRRRPKLTPSLQASGPLPSLCAPGVAKADPGTLQGPWQADPHRRQRHIEHCQGEAPLLPVPAAGASAGMQHAAWKVRGQVLQATRLSPCAQIGRRIEGGFRK